MSISRKAICIVTVLLLFVVSVADGKGTVSFADKTDGSKIIVSLGDSYASGEGVEPFYDQDDPYKQYNSLDWMAHRSEKSWSGQLTLPSVNGPMSKHKDENWFFVAASGATTEHMKGEQLKTATVYQLPIQYEVSQILPPQLSVFDNLGEGNTADYVTITIGGNDAHFSEIITLAATSSYYLNRNKLKQRIDQIWKEFYEEGGIRDKIKQAYHDIYDAAGPQVTIIVAGYPTLLDRTGKGAMFSIQEAEIINTAVEQFNVELEKIVIECQNEGLKICFVPIDFTGHEAYSKNSYLNPVWIGSRTEDLNAKIASHYSMHPNEKGIEQYRKAVQDKIDELEKYDPDSDTSHSEETESVFELWHCIAKSEVLQYIGLPYSDINQIAGDLNNVDVEFDSWLRYLYRFSNMEWLEFSFETDLYQAEEETGYLGYIPINTVKRYVKGNDRCDGVLINNLASIGFESSVTAESINAQVFEFMPDSGLWIAQTLRDGCDFYFICEDSNGLISDRCACWVVGELPAQAQEQQKNGWENKGRSTDTWEEGDWYYYVSGQPATGWKTIDGKTYYFHNDGKMAESLTTISGTTYFFQEHFYGAGPSTGDKPDHGTLSKGGFEQRSIGDMVFCDTNGSVITYDGEGNGAYFAYATNAFDLVWNYDQLSYNSDIADYGYFDIDRDGYKEFYIKRGSGEANFKYEFYTPDFQTARYKKIGTVDAAYCSLSMENSHLYLFNKQTDTKREIRIVNGRIEIDSSGSSLSSQSTSKTSLVEKLLSSSYAKEIGMTFGELKVKYGPLDYVYLATEEPIQAVFKNSKGSISYYFDGVADSIQDELWDESIANNGIISPSSAAKLIFDSDTCTGVYASFRTFGVANMNDYETWFTSDHIYYDELWDERYYVTEHDRYELSTRAYAISTTSDFHVDVDDWVEITLKRSYWSSHETPMKPETPISSKWHYDPYAARDAAEDVLNTIQGKGATYVSKLLREGGLTKVKQSGAGDLIDYLKNTKNWDSESIGKVVIDPAYSELHVGDILCSVCSKGSSASDYTNGHGKGKNLYYGIQVFFISEVGPDYIRVYSKNNDRHNEVIRLSCNGGDFIDKCGKCGNSKNVHWIAFVFDDAIKR